MDEDASNFQDKGPGIRIDVIIRRSMWGFSGRGAGDEMYRGRSGEEYNLIEI